MNIEDLNNQQPNTDNSQNSINQNIAGSVPPAEPISNVSEPPAPQMTTPPMPEPQPTINATSNIPPQAPQINLQPEGMMPPVNNTPQPSAPEPLMGATLTANSTLLNNGVNNQPPNPMDSGFNNSTMPNNQINSNNAFIQNQSNPFDMGVGVPTPPPMDGSMNQGNNKEKKKKEKKIRTPLLIALIIVLLVGIGYGIYYFLNISKQNNNTPIVTLKLTNWELGEELPMNIEDYATITNVDPASCTIDKTNLNINEVSTQKYSVSCPGLSTPVEGTLEMKDTKGPDVLTKDLIIVPNGTVNLEDFIVSCKDPSLDDGVCDISIKEGQTSLEELVKTVGSYEIALVVRDNYNNATELTVNLKVDENAPETSLKCEKEVESQELNAKVTTTYNYGITANNTLYNVEKITTFKFETIEDYEAAKTTYEEENNINGLEGTAKFETAAKAIIITSEIEKEALAKEFSLEQFPDTLGQIVSFHEERQDSCSLS